jgi:hypothetical protein
MRGVSQRLLHGRLRASVSDAVDAGVDLMPHFEMAAITVLNGRETPGDWPEIRRRLRAEGIRSERHRGVILLPPGDLDQIASLGMLEGLDELYLMSEWVEELEPFPGRITSDVTRFDLESPLGLEEWMIDSGCLLALGDGDGLNWATLDPALAETLKARFKPVPV